MKKLIATLTTVVALSGALALTGCSNTPAPVHSTKPAATHTPSTPAPAATPTEDANGAAQQQNSAKNFTCDANGTLTVGTNDAFTCTPGITVKVLLDEKGNIVSHQEEVKLSEDDQNTIDQLGK